jgi:hypothetical protein
MFVDNFIQVPGSDYTGNAVEVMNGVRFDPGMLRPYLGKNNERLVTINTGRMIYDNTKQIYLPERRPVRIRDLMNQGMFHSVWNATSLRKEEWIQLDQAVIPALRDRLRFYDDMKKASNFSGFNGMGKLTLEYETTNDVGEAVVDMDGLSPGRTDNPLFKLRSLPLPITHSDFWFSARRLAVSRSGGVPLDTRMVEMASRRCAEMVEDTAIGIETGIQFGTVASGVTAHDGLSKVYGATNFPYRITKTDLTTPTGSNPEAVMQDVIEMREEMYDIGAYGPFVLYTSTSYDAWLDNDYFRTGSTAISRTLRERIRGIEGIMDIRRLDQLNSGYQMLLIQMSSETLRAVTGMAFTVVQWESQGGMRLNFKVMGIEVPQFFADYDGDAAIVHGTTS